MKAVIVLVLLTAAISSMAAVPRVVNYQGFLMESPDGPPVEGTVDLIFGVYPDSLDGAALWTENHLQVPVTRGVFNVNLGEAEPFPTELFAHGDRWLEVYVPNFSTTLPRVKLTSVVWAMHASVADTALAFHGDLPAHVHALDELEDVEVAEPATGEALTWNGTEWTPLMPGAGYDDPRVYGYVDVPGGSVSGTWATYVTKEVAAPTAGFVWVFADCWSDGYVNQGPYAPASIVHTIDLRLEGAVLRSETWRLERIVPPVFGGGRVEMHTVVPVNEGMNVFEIGGSCTGLSDGNWCNWNNTRLWMFFFPVGSSDVTIVE